MIWIAGVNVNRAVVPELADRLASAGRKELATKLRGAASDETQTEVALSINEHEAVLAELDDPTEGLEELRGTLLAEQEGRQRRTRHGTGKKGRANADRRLGAGTLPKQQAPRRRGRGVPGRNKGTRAAPCFAKVTVAPAGRQRIPVERRHRIVRAPANASDAL